MKICPACGAENGDSTKFCLVCGKILTEVTPEAAEEEAVKEAGQEAPEQTEAEAAAKEAPSEPAEPETPAEPAEPAEPDFFEALFGKKSSGKEEKKPEAEAPESAGNAPEAEAPESPAETPEEEPAAVKPKEAGMLTTWQYFLLEALFALPIIGTVFLFIWSLSHPKNESLRRYASSVLIWRLILYVLVCAAAVYALLTAKTWLPDLANYLK